MLSLKAFTPEYLLAILVLVLMTLAFPAHSEELDNPNWIQKGSGLECTAVGVRADGTRSGPLTAVWQGDGVSGQPDRPIFNHINETENDLNVVEFEEFTFRGIKSRLAFAIEVFSEREKIALAVSQFIYRRGTKETLKSEQLIVKKSDFVVGADYFLELAIHKRWVAQYYEPFRSYQIECGLDWLEGN